MVDVRVLGVFASIVVATAQHLALNVRSNGSFEISHNGHAWLSGQEVIIGPHSSVTGDLVVVNSSETSGTDPLGRYQAKTFKWSARGAESKVLMHTSFRTYASDLGVVVFEQYFPDDLAIGKEWQAFSKRSSRASSTVFPGFSRRGGPADHLACFSYHGVFPQLEGCNVSSYKESHQGGVPLVIYDSADTDLPMVVFSPLSTPMAHHMVTGDLFFGAGIKATVELIPAGWSQLFVLSAGKGINAGMLDWGDRMLAFTGKPRADMYADDVIGTIGYWTDNGGYYHYDTGSNMTYEEVLPKVKAYHESLGVPFRHWQFDSWFYPKDGDVDPGGGGGAVTNWTALPSVFPTGMANIQSKLGLPMVMHNRQWSIKSDYIKQEPFKWYSSQKASVPVDPAAFFAYFFQQQQGWGLAMYEQDWMCTEYDDVEVLQTNISMGDLWLRGMADGAAGSGRTVQYCMPYANQVLSAAAYPAVTNARATGDYFHAKDQWAVGGTSLFYWAIGIIPFKDGFYSSTHKQTGGQTVGPETSPDREALMATLSCAMVGPMDGLGLLNSSRVMSSCRKDGTILKPDRPISTTDACFRLGQPACHIYHTFSEIQGLGRAHYFFSSDNVAMTADMVYLKSSDAYVVYNWYTGELSRLGESNKLSPGYEGHIYAIVTPVQQGWVVLGEVDKYVPLAKIRFTSIDASNVVLTLQVAGVAGEVVRLCAAELFDLKVRCTSIAFSASGTQKVSMATHRPTYV